MVGFGCTGLVRCLTQKWIFGDKLLFTHPIKTVGLLQNHTIPRAGYSCF